MGTKWSWKKKKKDKKTPKPTEKKPSKWSKHWHETPKPTPVPTLWSKPKPKPKKKKSVAAVNSVDTLFDSNHFKCNDIRQNGDIDYVILVDASCGLTDDVSDSLLDGVGDIVG